MIPTSEQLEAISRQREGVLDAVPFAVLLTALAAHERSVVLEIRRHQIWKRVVFELGVPVDCRSNLIHETLGRFLVAKGAITEEQSLATLNTAAARGAQQGEVLREEGLIDAYGLFRMLQENLAKKLLDPFTWRSGTFRMLFELPTVDSPLKVKVSQLVVTGISKFAAQEEIDLGVAALVGKKLALHPRPRFPLAEVRLNAQQVRLAEALASPRRLDELAEATRLPLDYIARQLYGLAVIGAVVPVELIPAGMGHGTAAVLEKPGGTTAIHLTDSAQETLRNEVLEAYLAHRRQDAFELLEAGEDENMDRLTERYLRFAERFAPWAFRESALAPLAEKAQDLFLAGARAWAELADAERRNALIARRRARREERQARPAADAFKIETDLLDPEVHFKKGLALKEKGEYLEASKLLEFASDCDPQNGLYRAERAYCRYLHSPQVNAKGTLQDLRDTVRIDPACGLAHLYLGELLAAQGDPSEAEPNLRKAAELMSPDRRPLEALKRLGKKR